VLDKQDSETQSENKVPEKQTEIATLIERTEKLQEKLSMESEARLKLERLISQLS